LETQVPALKRTTNNTDTGTNMYRLEVVQTLVHICTTL